MHSFSCKLKLIIAMSKKIVHVEIQRNPHSTEDRINIINEVVKYQKCYHEKCSHPSSMFDQLHSENISSISVYESQLDSRNGIGANSYEYKYHVFNLFDLEPADEVLEDSENNSPTATQWVLPSTEFVGLWDCLVYDSGIKDKLLMYIDTILHFSDRGVNPNVISCNRVVLLHGPPGTGKTSLCKALAQKLCVRLSHRFRHGSLLEVNSHSLFSKWFSESGNLVMKMFAKIEELVQEDDIFVCVLIDEVESLTCARASHDSGTEPSDAIRVVNALLTQIDRIKKYPNVIILTTSNVTSKIDLAFVDRADIKQYIGLPSPKAIYKILSSCIAELMRVDIICPYVALPDSVPAIADSSMTNVYWKKLVSISENCEGLSGRALRKLPFLAQACYINSSCCTLEVFLETLSMIVDEKFQELKEFQ